MESSLGEVKSVYQQMESSLGEGEISLLTEMESNLGKVKSVYQHSWRLTWGR